MGSCRSPPWGLISMTGPRVSGDVLECGKRPVQKVKCCSKYSVRRVTTRVQMLRSAKDCLSFVNMQPWLPGGQFPWPNTGRSARPKRDEG